MKFDKKGETRNETPSRACARKSNNVISGDDKNRTAIRLRTRGLAATNEARYQLKQRRPLTHL